MPQRSMQQIVKKFIDWVKAAGWPAALTWGVFQMKKALGLQQPTNLKIKPRQTMYPVVARLRGSSDMEVVNQIFVVDEYACVRNISSPVSSSILGPMSGIRAHIF